MDQQSFVHIEGMTVNAGLTFLIIDDDIDIQNVLSEYLELMGFNGKFIKAETILETKKALKREKIDFILCDWSLPDGQGIALLKALRNSPIFQKIPFVMVTGRNEVESMIQSSELGSSEYLTKPFELEDLREKLVGAWNYHAVKEGTINQYDSDRVEFLHEENNRLKIENADLKKQLRVLANTNN